MILKYFSPKHLGKNIAIFKLKILLVCAKMDHNIDFYEKHQFAAENCDHNIDPVNRTPSTSIKL
jgi:hypothetical protein